MINDVVEMRLWGLAGPFESNCLQDELSDMASTDWPTYLLKTHASGTPYIRCVDWKFCPFFCREDSIHSYQESLFNRVIPEYKVYEGGQLIYCRHMDVARSQKNPFRPYFTCRRKEM